MAIAIDFCDTKINYIALDGWICEFEYLNYIGGQGAILSSLTLLN